MQNFVNFYSPTIKSNNALYLPAEDAKVSFVDVHDIAATAVKTLTDDGKHIGKAYTITGPEALSYSRAAEILSNVTGKKISYVNAQAFKYAQASKNNTYVSATNLQLNIYQLSTTIVKKKFYLE